MAKYSLSRRYKKISNWVNLFVQKRIRKSTFTSDIVKNEYLEAGRYTYGKPEILVFPNGQTGHVFIGSFCSIAPDVKIFTGGNHRTDWVSTYPFNQYSQYFKQAAGITGQPYSKGDVVIGNDVWIGQGAVILSGVTIGDGAVIGAYSVVSRNVDPYDIVVGNPAKKIKRRFDDDTVNKLLSVQWWNWDIEKIRNEVTGLCSDNVAEFLKKHLA